MVQRARRRQRQKLSHTRLGMMRHLYLILDQSEAMTSQDLKPTRHLCTLKVAFGNFIEEFLNQNPISQLGNNINVKIKEQRRCVNLLRNPGKHLKVIRGLSTANCSGEPSLQNALDLAIRSLRLLPAHASREVLVLMASLTTCDPGDILVTIQELKTLGVRCSVLSLAAEVHVCRLLARETGGQFGVVLDDCHFRDLLLGHVDPPPAVTGLESSLIKMGFPHHQITEGKEAALSIHVEVSDGEPGGGLKAGGYFCPQCSSKYCELPVECRACNLTLVSAPHLARSYHHLFPVDVYVERERSEFEDSISHCFACRRLYVDSDKHVYECNRCAQVFCLDCDIFIHETMHVCPGCATNQTTLSSYIFVNSFKQSFRIKLFST
ncbi:General transcription factor IIH subunit, partial [Gryllus bimaculatus]